MNLRRRAWYGQFGSGANGATKERQRQPVALPCKGGPWTHVRWRKNRGGGEPGDAARQLPWKPIMAISRRDSLVMA